MEIEEFIMPKQRPKSATKHYDVGYRKPPKQSQFKKGQIGNPGGINRKASASPDLKVIVERELNAKVKLRPGEADKKITKGAAGSTFEGFAVSERDAGLFAQQNKVTQGAGIALGISIDQSLYGCSPIS
jgi:Family of unknown function (DUF5681)